MIGAYNSLLFYVIWYNITICGVTELEYTVNGKTYDTTSSVNRTILKKLIAKHVKAEATFLVECLKDSNKVNFYEYTSNRVTDPSCDFCGSGILHCVDVRSAIQTLPWFRDDLESWYVCYGHDTHDTPNEQQLLDFCESFYGSNQELWVCDKCQHVQKSVSIINYHCSSEQCVEWLIVSKKLYEKLRAHGEITSVFAGMEIPVEDQWYFWGRVLHDGVLLDEWDEPAIERIAYDDEILQGQRRSLHK